MRKSLLSLIAIAVIIFSASCSKDDNGSHHNGATGTLTATLVFSESASLRAGSNAIPETSWSSIKDITLFLYETGGSGKIVYSTSFTPSEMSSEAGNVKKKVFTDVPTGTYQLALVANAKQSNIRTSLDAGATYTTWTSVNLYDKPLDNLRVTYPTGSQPASSSLTGKEWMDQPAEVFTAYSANDVAVVEGTPTNVTGLELKRDVSLFRARINRIDSDAEYDNSAVSFTHDSAYVRIDKLSEGMKVIKGNNVLDNANADWILTSGDIKDTDPVSGYGSNDSNPVKILTDHFEFWNDIILFPNVSRNAGYNAAVTADAQYFVVVAGWAAAGHKLSNGKTTEKDGLVYWEGTVEAAFVPNVIREVNLTLKTGGTTTEPVDPPTYGSLNIEVKEPLAWDSNIQDTWMDL